MDLGPGLCEHSVVPDEREPENRIDLSSLERLSPSAPAPENKRPLVPRLLAVLGFAAAASVVVAIPWFFLTRTPAPKVSSTPSPTPRPPASPSVSPSPVVVPGTYEVTGVKNCLRVHSGPGLATPVIDCIGAGIQVTSDGITRSKDGYRWLHIHDPVAKTDGWAADAYLKHVG